MSRDVPLSGGGVAIVSEEDYATVMLWRWRLNKAGYVCRTGYRNGRRITILLHRFILDAPDGVEVDHKNRVRHDCRRQNLRLATRVQNERNKGLMKARNTTGFKGVTLDKRSGKYRAKVFRDGRYIHIGMYHSPDAASEAYEKYLAGGGVAYAGVSDIRASRDGKNDHDIEEPPTGGGEVRG